MEQAACGRRSAARSLVQITLPVGRVVPVMVGLLVTVSAWGADPAPEKKFLAPPDDLPLYFGKVTIPEKLPEGLVQAPWAVPVNGMAGWAPFHHCVSGLTLVVEDAGWPVVSMLSSEPDAPVHGAFKGSGKQARDLLPYPFLFGCISAAGPGKLKSQQADAVSNTLVFGNEGDELTVTVTRLSPAILISSRSGRLELFGREPNVIHPVGADMAPPAPGTVKPLRWAAPGADGKVITGIWGTQPECSLPLLVGNQAPSKAPSSAPAQPSLPPLASLEKGWLLLWYGSDSPFVSTKLSQGLLPGQNNFLTLRIKSFYQADVPLLLVFGRAPKAIEYPAEGGAARLQISMGASSPKIALLPLFGHDVRPAAETESWLASFPAEVKERCDLWAEAAAAIPVGVRETAAYDPQADRVTLTEKFDFVKVRPGRRLLAPVPPMLALAYSQGLPVQFSAQPVDLRLPTQFGPMMGLPGESYTWSLVGLGKIVGATARLGPPNPKASELEAELVAEVDKVLAAGHLAPWFFLTRRHGFVNFRDPSETLYLLAEILPVLPPDRQEKLRAYLKKEYEAYPPQQVKELDINQGARREIRKVNYNAKIFGDLNYKVVSTAAPSYALHEPTPAIYRANGVAAYCRALGQTPTPDILDAWKQAAEESLRGRDWATLGWFWGKYDQWQSPGYLRTISKGLPPADLANRLRLVFYSNTVRQVHRDAAGLIGYLQLCRMAGRSGEPEVWGQLARLTALRFALARYGRYLATSGIFQMPDDPEIKAQLARSADFSKPENHLQQLLCLNQHGAILYSCASKELSRYTPSYYRPDNRSGAGNLGYGSCPRYENYFFDMSAPFARILGRFGFDEDARRFLAFYEDVQPLWYTVLADNTQFCDSELANMFPTDAHQIFMGHAWLAGTPPEKLERYLHEPSTPLGDLYYLHKLAETIKAYRGVTWVATGSKPETRP